MDTIQVWELKREDLAEQALVTPQELSKPQRAILETLGVFQFLTAEQLTRLLYAPMSRTYVQKHLLDLTRNKYLTTLLPPKQTRYGSSPYVYTLTTKGRNYLTSEGMEVPTRFRPSEVQRRRGGSILHTLAVNEVLLQAHLLPRLRPDLELVEFVTERELTRDPLKVVLPPDNKTVSLSPDLWLDFRRGRVHYTFCIEVNLTPVEQKRWRQKVRSYYYCLPAYQARFGTEAIVVSVMVASPSDFPRRRAGGATAPLDEKEVLEQRQEERRREKRLEDLLHWTELELEALDALHEVDLFCIGKVSASALTPDTLFLTPSFFMPSVEAPVALISDTDDTEEVSGE